MAAHTRGDEGRTAVPAPAKGSKMHSASVHVMQAVDQLEAMSDDEMLADVLASLKKVSILICTARGTSTARASRHCIWLQAVEGALLRLQKCTGWTSGQLGVPFSAGSLPRLRPEGSRTLLDCSPAAVDVCLPFCCPSPQICPDGFHKPLDYTVTRWKKVRRAVEATHQHGQCE